MKIYRDNTIMEWSRKLQSKYGTKFRTYSSNEETLERWRQHLSFIFKQTFVIRESEERTLEEWSKLIGG